MESLTGAPVLSTPSDRILRETDLESVPSRHVQFSDEQLDFHYEIGRTIEEIRKHKWRRTALQFPDHMLADSARVYQRLARGLSPVETRGQNHECRDVHDDARFPQKIIASEVTSPVKLMILGDTSYGSCCVDEVAAEHADADALVHYGRACLSSTSRIPVLHVFTAAELQRENVLEAFKKSFSDLNARVVLTADAPFSWHVVPIAKSLEAEGYTSIFATEIIHDPLSVIPNRTVPANVKADPQELQDWHVFHISNPPTALLLTLSSRVKSMLIYPSGEHTSTAHPSVSETNTAMILRRRYALITSLTTVSTWGILINTLSVKNYLDVVEHVKQVIAAAGKKSYLFVVGKINPAKVANFSEIGGWVVIGCWESSLIDSKDFFKPIITPFELELALTEDDRRVWTGQWISDFQKVLNDAEEAGRETGYDGVVRKDIDQDEDKHELESEEESEPPEFDLRTGRYVQHSRPMSGPTREVARTMVVSDRVPSQALTKRANLDVLAVNGVASPAAQYLADKRTWKGLGSDFEIKYEDDGEPGATIQEGHSGVPRGYHRDDSKAMR